MILLAAARFLVTQPTALTLCVVFAVGRFYQTGLHALDGGLAQVLLEIVVEGARVLLAIAVVGNGSISGGVQAIRRFFALPKAAKQWQVDACMQRIRATWKSLTLEIVGFIAIAIALNIAIAWFARTDTAAEFAAALGIDQPPQVPVTLLLKNFTVIPFTIAFELLLARSVWAPHR